MMAEKKSWSKEKKATVHLSLPSSLGTERQKLLRRRLSADEGRKDWKAKQERNETEIPQRSQPSEMTNLASLPSDGGIKQEIMKLFMTYQIPPHLHYACPQAYLNSTYQSSSHPNQYPKIPLPSELTSLSWIMLTIKKISIHRVNFITKLKHLIN
jgi:hypothetical protein